MSFDFYKRAAIVCRAIPYGKTATYGQIALLCGKPENARQVGYALNRKKDGWHNTMDEAMQFQQIFGSLGI